jgi:hypothetical protein
MTTIPMMVRTKPDAIPDLMVKNHAAQQSKTGGRNRPSQQLPIDWWEDGEMQGPPAESQPGYDMPTRDLRIHEAIDAIAAVILRAEAGLNWLDAEQPRLEEAREALQAVARDARRTAEIVLRLRGA